MSSAGSAIPASGGSVCELRQGISVVVPVYNREASLRELVEKLEGALGPGPFETILVNDGSRDTSWDVIAEIASRNPRVRGINLMRNFGQHNALLCGIRAAQYDITVTIDDDLQNPPAEIPKLLANLAQGGDVVYGVPLREQHGLLRDLASAITKMVLSNAMGAEMARHVSAFRAFRTQLRDAFAKFDGPYVSIDVLLTWGTTRFAGVEVDHQPRKQGVSGYTLGKLVRHGLNMMTGFSTMPLRIASIVGFAFTAFGLGILAYVLTRYVLYGSTVKGFPFLASEIAILAGAQLFALGIIGEYLARMHFRSMQRPTYVTLSSDHTAAERKAAGA